MEYIKLDDFNNKIQVIINCSDEDVQLKETNGLLFSTLLEDNILKKNGTIIRKI